jgi:hypothetical protein
MLGITFRSKTGSTPQSLEEVWLFDRPNVGEVFGGKVIFKPFAEGGFDPFRMMPVTLGTPLVRFLGGGWLGNPRQENESMTLVSQRNGSPDFHLLPYFGLDFFDEKFFCHRQSASPG